MPSGSGSRIREHILMWNPPEAGADTTEDAQILVRMGLIGLAVADLHTSQAIPGVIPLKRELQQEAPPIIQEVPTIIPVSYSPARL